MSVFALETGVLAPGADPLGDLAFGARYISYRSIDRFDVQTNDLDPGLIVWPGGTLAETRTDRYGFEHDGLYAPETGKPGLDDMMAYAVSEGAGLSVVLPTVRYNGDPATYAAEVQGFVADLLAGTYGPLPSELILEVGNEYYAHFSGPDAAADYAELAEAAITEIALALADPAVNTLGADLTIAVQAGKTLADDAIIRAGLSDFAQGEVDMIVDHRFTPQPEGVDEGTADAGALVDAWAAEAVGLGAVAPELFVSAWNVASLTRQEALEDYATITGTDPGSVDLDGRTNAGFEAYWQEALGAYAYGPEQATLLLETFDYYAEAGMSAGAIFGTDSVHPGTLSFRDVNGENHEFIGTTIYEMMRESLLDTVPLTGEADYNPDAPATLYGFESDDLLVVFVAAGETPPGEITLGIDGMAAAYLGHRADAVEAVIPEDWMTLYAVPDNPEVNEAPEALTFVEGYRERLDTVEIAGDSVTYTLDAPHGVLRLAFAKTDAGLTEIESWDAGGGGLPAGYVTAEEFLTLSGDGGDAPGDIPTVPVDEDASVPDEPEDTADAGDGGGAGFGGALGILSILPLLLFL